MLVCVISIFIIQKEIMGHPIAEDSLGHPIIIPDKKPSPHDGNLPPVLCPTVCPLIYKPICACDPLGRKRTFSNSCFMNVEICQCKIRKYGT